MQELSKRKKNQGGFTLIELLIAIVVVGILTAVAIVGIGGLVDNGTKSACNATAKTARAATAVHFANTGAYPANFAAMTGSPKELELASGVTNPSGGVTLTGKDWTLTMNSPGTSSINYGGC